MEHGKGGAALRPLARVTAGSIVAVKRSPENGERIRDAATSPPLTSEGREPTRKKQSARS
jgi:hypothetical protein